MELYLACDYALQAAIFTTVPSQRAALQIERRSALAAGRHERQSTCLVWDKVCDSCRKMNHFSTVCLPKSATTT